MKTAFATIAVLPIITHPTNMIMTIVPRTIAAMASVIKIEEYLHETDKRTSKAKITTTLALSATLNQTNFQLGASPKSPVFGDITLIIEPGVTIYVGPVGSGKSTLARALLGELDCVSGTAALRYSRVGFCEQTPWIPVGSVRDAITGLSKENRDPQWFDTVVRVCCLVEDLQMLPHGDQTFIASRGMNVSGGQRQRVVSF